MSDRVEGFAPVCFADSRVLILGSFPSVKSRAEGFYYGNPRNRTACSIHASEDASIREADRADVAGLIRGTAVHTVLCNGKAAFAYLPKEFLPDHVRVLCLPSTSPANPRFSADTWRAALAEALEEG